MIQKKYYLTKKGLEKLKEEYKILKDIKMRSMEEAAPPPLEGEDINPDFIYFQQDLEATEKRLMEIENILNNVEIIKKPPKLKQNQVCLGAKVFLEDQKAKKSEFKIVGTLEANPFVGMISDESPLGKAFIGRRVGDLISLNTDSRYKLLKIQYETA